MRLFFWRKPPATEAQQQQWVRLLQSYVGLLNWAIDRALAAGLVVRVDPLYEHHVRLYVGKVLE